MQTSEVVLDAGSPANGPYDEKNIRRRVYDALNVLMAMDIITKVCSVRCIGHHLQGDPAIHVRANMAWGQWMTTAFCAATACLCHDVYQLL